VLLAGGKVACKGMLSVTLISFTIGAFGRGQAQVLRACTGLAAKLQACTGKQPQCSGKGGSIETMYLAALASADNPFAGAVGAMFGLD